MFQLLRSRLRRFAGEQSGGLMPLFSVVLIPILGATAAALDYAVWLEKKSHLQGAADAAALAGAREMIDGTDGSAVQQAERVLAANLRYPAEHQIAVVEQGRTLRVRLELDADRILSGFLSSAQTRIAVSATATGTEDSGSPFCVLALNPDAETGILVHGSAELEAEGCVLWSNSGGDKSFHSYPSSTVRADDICAVGGISVRGTVEPYPRAGCRRQEDPLADWEPPHSDAPCEAELPERDEDGVLRLAAGTYCGLSFETGKVELTGGTYIIKDNPFSLRGNVEVYGEGVGIYLTGPDARLDFAGTGSLSITAQGASSDMPGLAIARNPAAPSQGESQVGHESYVTGNFTLSFLGTIYLPNQTFSFWGNSDTAVKPPVSQIIADRIEVGGNGRLHLQSQGEDSSIPPVTSASKRVLLVE